MELNGAADLLIFSFILVQIEKLSKHGKRESCMDNEMYLQIEFFN